MTVLTAILAALPVGRSAGLRVDLLFGIVFALLGYRISSQHRAIRGVTPWRIPSVGWALICLFFQPFGIIVEFVAGRTTRGARTVAAAPAQSMAYPAPTIAPTDSDDQDGDSRGSRFAPPASDGTGKTPLFGWYEDVTGRHALRYWDGRKWSDQVRDANEVTTDPLENENR